MFYLIGWLNDYFLKIKIYKKILFLMSTLVKEKESQTISVEIVIDINSLHFDGLSQTY